MSKPMRFTRVYPHPPERVWRALTDHVALSEWMMPATEFQPVVGQTFQFRVDPVPGWRGIVDCEVLEVEPLRRLVVSWAGHENQKHPTRVTWTLEPAEGGTRLELEQTGFRGIRGFFDRIFMNMGLSRMYGDALPKVLERVSDDGYEPFGYWLHDRKRKSQ